MKNIKLGMIVFFLLAGVYFMYSSTQFEYREAAMSLVLLELKAIKAILCLGFAGMFFINYQSKNN